MPNPNEVEPAPKCGGCGLDCIVVVIKGCPRHIVPPQCFLKNGERVKPDVFKL